jgi:hypothetical protein
MTTLRARVLAGSIGVLLALGGSSAWLVATAGPAAADVILVDDTSDPVSGVASHCTDMVMGNCSLRDAFAAATSVVGDTISLQPTTYSLSNGQLVGGGTPLIIDGNSATIDQNTVGSRVIQANADLTLTSVTITGGTVSAGGGGGIDSSGGMLTLTDSSVSGNTAVGGGGGIRGGNVTLTRSAVTGNTATTSDGGALSASGGAVWQFTDSTISGNTVLAGSGGAGFMGASGTSPSVTVTRSTVSGNTASVGSGGIQTIGQPITAIDSTIADNVGGGPALGADAVTLVYSTVTHNTGGDIGTITLTSFGSVVADPVTTACSVTTTISQGYNYEEGSSPGSCGFGGGVGDVVASVDPQLDPLGAYGGPTQTRRPQATSPLLGAIPVASCGGSGGSIPAIRLDQRGQHRDAEPGCDIGADELGGGLSGGVRDLVAPPAGVGTGLSYPPPAVIKVRICPNADPNCAGTPPIAATASSTTGAYDIGLAPNTYVAAAIYCKGAAGCAPGMPAAIVGPNSAPFAITDGSGSGVGFTIGFRPDVQTRLKGTLTFTGANNYAPPNAVQTRAAGVKASKTVTFLIQIDNDGNLADKILVKASVAGSSKMSVAFKEGPFPIPNVATTGRTYALAPGASKTIIVIVTAKSGAPKLASKTVTIVAKSTNQGAGAKSDTIKVKAIRT